MVKVIKVYPWVGLMIGTTVASVIIAPNVITEGLSTYDININDVWPVFDIPSALLFFIFLLSGPFIGCFYGWIMDKGKIALIIGGIVGLFSVSHPAFFSSFVLFGGSLIIGNLSMSEDERFKSGEDLCFYCWLPFTIISIVTGALFLICENKWGGLLIAFGLIPLINPHTAFIASICIGFYFYPLLVFPALSIEGYVVGKLIGNYTAKREAYKQKIKEYKSIIRKWKEEGYDVSELEGMVRRR